MKLRFAIALAATIALGVVPASAGAKGTMYVVGSGSSTVAPLAIGPAGGLSPVGAAVATGNTPRAAAVTPNAQNLYVSSVGGDSISVYTIGSNGSLTPLSAAVPTGTDPTGLAISPNGLFLFAANQGSNNISGFAIGSNGSLVPLGGSPYPAANVKNVAITADGLHLYATVDTGVRAFDINQTTGALTNVGGVSAAGTNPEGLATTPDSRFLYITNNGSANVTGFSIGADGSLTSLGNTATGNVPRTPAVTPNGSFLYTPNFGSNTVSGFVIGAGGALTPATGQPFAASTQPFGLDASPNGQNVYASGFNNNLAAPVDGYSIGSGGAMASISGSPFASGVNGSEFQSVAITPNQGPRALFTATPQGAGNETLFSGSSSSDPDGGTIARYDWDFGDGSTLANGGPTPTHVYAAAGDYQVTLVVTDDEGCSTTVVFTGQTADCNGSASARETQTVPISASDTVPDLTLSAKKQKLGKVVKVKAKTLDQTEAVAKGKLKTEGPKKGKAALGSYSLKKDTETLTGDGKQTLKLKIPSKARKKGKQALKKGGKVTAKINVKVTDADDDTDKASVKVKLTKK
ncbi:MAG: beta-propeller fold lactonase family protein [Solirubrobacterales bacterium]